MFFDLKALRVDCSDIAEHHQFRRQGFDLDQLDQLSCAWFRLVAHVIAFAGIV